MAFLKAEKPKQFNYIPRYYDEQKEELQTRIDKVTKQTQASESGEYTPNLKGQFKKRHEAFWGQPAKSKGRKVSRMMMMVVYAVLVVGIIYLTLNILSYL